MHGSQNDILMVDTLRKGNINWWTPFENQVSTPLITKPLSFEEHWLDITNKISAGHGFFIDNIDLPFIDNRLGSTRN